MNIHFRFLFLTVEDGQAEVDLLADLSLSEKGIKINQIQTRDSSGFLKQVVQPRCAFGEEVPSAVRRLDASVRTQKLFYIQCCSSCQKRAHFSETADFHATVLCKYKQSGEALAVFTIDISEKVMKVILQPK